MVPQVCDLKAALQVQGQREVQERPGPALPPHFKLKASPLLQPWEVGTLAILSSQGEKQRLRI